MKELDAITSRLRDISTLAELLDAGFDAFEAIRLVAPARTAHQTCSPRS
jgi:hypothetical protein